MRICFLGDSFINGTGDPHCLGWVGRVSAQARASGCDVTCYNLGIRRNTSQDIAARWQAEAALRLPPEIAGMLVFSFGVNDCCDEDGCRRVAPEASVATTRSILSEAVRHRPTLMVGPPPIAAPDINHRIAALSQALSNVCRDMGVPFLDAFTPLSANPVWMHETDTGDGAHPGAGGYDALTALVSAWPDWRRAVSA
ncbi:MAG: lipase [Rhodospirillaceae bacterium]|nr:lipase [Rhodospirillales bacterium]